MASNPFLALSRRCERGYPVSDWAADAAAEAGNVAALDFLLTRGAQPGTYGVSHAGEAGRLAFLQQLHERGLFMRPERASHCMGLLVAAAEQGHSETVAWLVEALRLSPRIGGRKTLTAAARSGRVELLAWLHGRGCPLGTDAFTVAVESGCGAALEWLAEAGCPLPTTGKPYLRAARNRDLATLRCLARLGCPWGAAEAGEGVFTKCMWSGMGPVLPVLRCLVELGCPVDWDSIPRPKRWWPQGVREWLAQEQGRQAALRRQWPALARQQLRREQQERERRVRAERREKRRK